MSVIWKRIGLAVVAIALAVVLWLQLRQPLPDPLIGGFAALGLGVVVVLLATSWWKK